MCLATLAPAAPVAARSAPPTCNGLRATVVGTSHADHLIGTPHRDVIVGLGGDDVIDGRGGNDVICGGLGSDDLSGGTGDDRLFGNEVSYERSATGVVVDLSARPGIGKVTGEGVDTVKLFKHLTVTGSSHADTMTGTEGPDTLVGGAGNDTMFGLGGNDELTPEREDLKQRADADVVYGGAGDDRVISYKGRDEIHGGDGADQLVSFAKAPATIHGDAGNDDIAMNLTQTSPYAADGGTGTDSLTLGDRTARHRAARFLAAARSHW